MIKKIPLTLFLGILLCFFSTNSYAQLEKGQLVDGISAVIGDEIVLESDILEQMEYGKQQGHTGNRCETFEQIVHNKVMVYAGKKDTLIENRTAMIKENANLKYNQFLSQYPDEKTMLAAYKFRTSYEMKNAIERLDTDQYYGQQKYMRITDKADVTPNQVTDFYHIYQSQLPPVKDEVSLSRISITPKLTEAHKQELIEKLNKIRKDILAGESFESQARIFSEDEGSASNGGLYKNIRRGQMVKSFEATALNLQEDEISEPVESEFGFHIIQLVKRSGKNYDARHILLKAVPTEEEIETAKKDLENIKKSIQDGKITFKEAAYKYSDDKKTKFNGGIMSGEDGSSKIEKSELPADAAYQIAGLNKGDLSEVFVHDGDRGKKEVTLIEVQDVIPAHQMTLENDYDRIKQMALNKKKNEMVDKWIKNEIPNIFISIDNRYNDCDFTKKWEKETMIK